MAFKQVLLNANTQQALSYDGMNYLNQAQKWLV